jgi:outer membrane protein with beta-barrel domain
MKGRPLAATGVGVLVALGAASVAAQDRPTLIVEGVTGYAGFVDEDWIDRTMIGAGARVFVTPRIAIGPEYVYLRGTLDEHDWTLTGNATIDVLVERGPARRRVIPYIAVGAGYLRQTTQVGTGSFTSSEGTVSGGIGARIAMGPRFFIAPEFRMGWEPEMRIGVTLGMRGRRR